MARIIEQGYHRLNCRTCNTLFEYTHSETKERKYNHDYLGDYDIAKFVKCPSCDNWCIIKEAL